MIAFGIALAPPLSLKAERLDTRFSPQEFFAKIREDRETVFLLESAKGNDKLAEYSFIGFDPAKLITVRAGVFEVTDLETGTKERMTNVADPLKEIRRLVPPDSISGLFRFIGGAVGYFSYDAVRYWERLPNKTSTDQGMMPDAEFGIFNDGVVFDHARKEAYYYTVGKNRIEEVKRAARAKVSVAGPLSVSPPSSSMSQDKFEGIVETAKEYIAAGDIFQAVLSKRYNLEVKGELSRFYSSLSKINPSPYMYFLKFGRRQIIGSSPEMLVRVEDREVETFPIAGTRPHLRDREKNAKLTRDLLADPKENAEHLMLVDLARNDVGRVSAYGSVKVPEFLTVQQFSHVQHIVSHVVGELRQGFDSYDALRALFPAGTVSGAPKVRAMEIIEELEITRRGPYAGAVGYFSFNGNADFAITIRTLVANGPQCSIQAGAGIVADSQPDKEWEETEAKAAGLLRALRAATGGAEK